ncbi:MAG: hypothetical protein GY771_09305 [bacterium]|nr:hypothetical protein [bacterium]
MVARKKASNIVRRSLLIGLPAYLIFLFLWFIFGSMLFGEDVGAVVSSWWCFLMMLFPLIGGVVFGTLWFLWKPMLSVMGGGLKDRRLRRKGRPAKAKILSVDRSPQGIPVSAGQHLYQGYTLEVDDGFRTPYSITVEMSVPVNEILKYQPGTVIDVVVDPDDPEKVVVVR